MKKGFTLVEVLVAVSIMTIIGWALVSVLKVADTVWDADAGLMDLQQEVRQVMDGMIREARQAPADSIIVSNDGARVDFSIPSATGVISYYLNGKNLMREHPAGTSKVLAGDINKVVFGCVVGGAVSAVCEDADIFRIGLSADKNVKGRVISFPVSGVLTEQVRLRN